MNNCLTSTGGDNDTISFSISLVLVTKWTAYQTLVIGLLNLTTIVALMYVVIRVYRQERYLNLMLKMVYGNVTLGPCTNDGRDRKLASAKKRQTFIKAFTAQCVAYIVTHLVCEFSSAAHYFYKGQTGWRSGGMWGFNFIMHPSDLCKDFSTCLSL